MAKRRRSKAVTRAKRRVSRATGVPWTKSGRKRKVKRSLMGGCLGGCLLPIVSGMLLVVAIIMFIF